MSELTDAFEEAVEIAELAAQTAHSYFRKSLLIELKENFTPVTVADKKTEEQIREALMRRFPGHGIIGEEFGAESEQAEYVWTVDPIDGTRSFIRGIPLYGTLLGLLHHGEPVVGVMVLPGIGETYSAALGEGAFCNGQRIHVSSPTSLQETIVVTGDSSAFKEIGRAAMISDLIDRTGLVRGYSDCFGHALVMRGGAEAMLDPIVSLWDIAPVACLIKEAGGDYFDFTGERTFRSSSFVTCTPALKSHIMPSLTVFL